MVKASIPELRRFMDKRVYLRLSRNRKMMGIIRGFDPFLNLVIDEAIPIENDSDIHQILQQPPPYESLGMVVIRGNSILMMEALEYII